MSSPVSQFAVPTDWFSGAHLAEVVSIDDTDSRGKIQIRLLAADPDGEALIWARVATGFAGESYGAFFIPGVGEEVLVVFTGNDVRHPVVIGALWNGGTEVPETISGDTDRWTITGKAGTRVAIVEEASGSEFVEISTPAGATATVTDEGGGKIELDVGSDNVTMDTSGITVKADSKVTVQGSSVLIKAPTVTVNAGTSTFSGSIVCADITTGSIKSGTYSPGAGNIW